MPLWRGGGGGCQGAAVHGGCAAVDLRPACPAGEGMRSAEAERLWCRAVGDPRGGAGAEGEVRTPCTRSARVMQLSIGGCSGFGWAAGGLA